MVGIVAVCNLWDETVGAGDLTGGFYFEGSGANATVVNVFFNTA